MFLTPDLGGDILLEKLQAIDNAGKGEAIKIIYMYPKAFLPTSR